MPNNHAAKKIEVNGIVQGVGFRPFVYRLASTHQLTGWVRNCPDGSVEALCSGSRDLVNQMIDWLHQGPDSALVNRVDIDELENQSPPQHEFTIRYYT